MKTNKQTRLGSNGVSFINLDMEESVFIIGALLYSRVTEAERSQPAVLFWGKSDPYGDWREINVVLSILVDGHITWRNNKQIHQQLSQNISFYWSSIWITTRQKRKSHREEVLNVQECAIAVAIHSCGLDCLGGNIALIRLFGVFQLWNHILWLLMLWTQQKKRKKERKQIITHFLLHKWSTVNTYSAIPQVIPLKYNVSFKIAHFRHGSNAMHMQMFDTYERWPMESIRNIIQILSLAPEYFL